MVYVQTRIRPRKLDLQTSLGFWDTNGSPNPDQKTQLSLTKKKGTKHFMEFAILEDHTAKMKERKMIVKYLDFVRELKIKNWWTWITVIPIVFCALGTVCKGPEKKVEELEISERIRPRLTIVLLKSARISGRVLVT